MGGFEIVQKKKPLRAESYLTETVNYSVSEGEKKSVYLRKHPPLLFPTFGNSPNSFLSILATENNKVLNPNWPKAYII